MTVEKMRIVNKNIRKLMNDIRERVLNLAKWSEDTLALEEKNEMNPVAQSVVVHLDLEELNKKLAKFLQKEETLDIREIKGLYNDIDKINTFLHQCRTYLQKFVDFSKIERGKFYKKNIEESLNKLENNLKDIDDKIYKICEKTGIEGFDEKQMIFYYDIMCTNCIRIV